LEASILQLSLEVFWLLLFCLAGSGPTVDFPVLASLISIVDLTSLQKILIKSKVEKSFLHELSSCKPSEYELDREYSILLVGLCIKPFSFTSLLESKLFVIPMNINIFI